MIHVYIFFYFVPLAYDSNQPRMWQKRVSAACGSSTRHFPNPEKQLTKNRKSVNWITDYWQRRADLYSLYTFLSSYSSIRKGGFSFYEVDFVCRVIHRVKIPAVVSDVETEGGEVQGNIVTPWYIPPKRWKICKIIQQVDKQVPWEVLQTKFTRFLKI